MSASVAQSFTVYTGIWINWSYGKIQGSTLTLDQRGANLLIAFTALFVTLVAVHVWNIACFALHAIYSSPRRHDIVHHQKQAILRNYRDPGSAALALIRVAWTWRRVRKTHKQLVLLGLCLLVSVGLTIATGFSSRIARDDHEVLLRGHQCGQFSKVDTTDSSAPLLADRMNMALSYAAQCYNGESNALSECGVLINTRLKTSKTRHTDCPFGSLCKANTTSIAMDSGIIDSHKDLGMNTPQSQRFALRNTWQCSVLETRGHTSVMNVSSTQSFKMYNYSLGSDGRVQTTHMASNDALDDYMRAVLPENDVQRSVAPQPDYSLGYVRYVNPYMTICQQLTFSSAEIAVFKNGSFAIGGYGFRPIDELGSKIADTNLVFLGSNAIVFEGESLDPWYYATTPAYEVTSGAGMPVRTMYAADDPAPPMACSIQYRTCNPTLPEERSCGAPIGIFGNIEGAHEILTYQEDHDMINWLEDYLYAFPQPRDIVFGLGSHSLQSRNRLQAGLQSGLPVDQWENDVEHWFNIASASLQYFPVLTAAGYFPNLTETAIRRPNSTSEVGICQNQVRTPHYGYIIAQVMRLIVSRQKIKSTAFVSFSVLWISLVFAVGLLLITLSLSLESLCRIISRRAGSLRYPLAEWNSNGCLQLQRQAFEELGIGQWKGCNQYVPFTEGQTDVGPLDISEPKHPRLSKPELSDDTPKPKASESMQDLQTISTTECGSPGSPSGGGALGQFAWENQNASKATA